MPEWQLASRNHVMAPSAIREIMKMTERPGVVSFAGGFPSGETFPVEAIASACSRVLERDGPSAVQYAATEGFAPLREWIAADLQRRGMPVDPAQVLVTSGSQQGLDLVARVLVDKGSPLFVESPTYVGALSAFRSTEPEVIGIGGDEDGPDLKELSAAQEHARDRHGQGARLFYVVPNYQNPTGRCIAASRREALAAQALRLGIPLVEDDPYGELWYEARPPAPLLAHAPQGCVYLGSLSKILAPGLRLGYIVAPRQLMPRLVQAKQATDLQTATFTQRVTAEILRDGFMERQGPALRALYRSQRDAMLQALERECGPMRLLSWTRPAGGMFIWAKLPEGLDATELLETAVGRGVAYVPGAVFFPRDPDRTALRLSFATPNLEQIQTGVASLAAAIRRALDP